MRGSVYRQKHHTRYTIQWYENGVRKQKPSGTTDKKEADAMLASIVGAVADGRPVIEVGRKAWTFEQATEALRVYATNEKLASLDAMMRSIANHLAPVFQKRKMETITSKEVIAYETARLATGAKRATVNNELATLRRMFTLGIESDIITRRPKIKCPDPKNARKGFFEDHEFTAFCRHLPPWLRDPAIVAFYTGWRLGSEIAPLGWERVDLVRGTIRLYDSKNGEGRLFPFRHLPDVVAVFARADRERRRLAQTGRVVRFVFHRDGLSIAKAPYGSKHLPELTLWARVVWNGAATKAGVPERRPHDCRRTVVRRMTRHGVDRKRAKLLVGLKSDRIYERYDIVDEPALDEAAALYAAGFAARRPRPARRTPRRLRLVS